MDKNKDKDKGKPPPTAGTSQATPQTPSQSPRKLSDKSTKSTVSVRRLSDKSTKPTGPSPTKAPEKSTTSILSARPTDKSPPRASVISLSPRKEGGQLDVHVTDQLSRSARIDSGVAHRRVSISPHSPRIASTASIHGHDLFTPTPDIARASVIVDHEILRPWQNIDVKSKSTAGIHRERASTTLHEDSDYSSIADELSSKLLKDWQESHGAPRASTASVSSVASVVRSPPKVRRATIQSRVSDGKKKKVSRPVIRLTKKRARGLFGNRSKLSQVNDFLLKCGTSTSEEMDASLPSGNTTGPDMTWLEDSDGKSSTQEEKDAIDISYQEKVVGAVSSILLSLTILGRFPFTLHGPVERNENKRLEYTFNKRSFNFIFFVITSSILFIIYTISGISAMHILSNNGTTEPYDQLEILYLQKYWLQYAIFMSMLTFIFVSNVATLIYGKSMARFISDVICSSSQMKFDGTKYLCLYSTINILLMIGVFCYMIAQLSYPATPGIRGGTALITISIFHFFVPGIRVNFPVFNAMSGVVLVLQMYVFVSARLAILFPCLLSIIIRNLAAQWNLRCALILRKVGTWKDPTLEKIKKKATYTLLLRYHNIITALIRGISDKGFIPIFLVYFGLAFITLCLVLYKLTRTFGISFFVDEDKDELGNNTMVKIVNEPYKDDKFKTVFDTTLLLLMTLGGFLATAECFAECSYKVQEGCDYVRRQGLLPNLRVQERKFILTLMETFGTKRPLIISPGNYIELTRPFISGVSLQYAGCTAIQSRADFSLKILQESLVYLWYGPFFRLQEIIERATIQEDIQQEIGTGFCLTAVTLLAVMTIFSIMMQSESNTFVRTPILGLCANDSAVLCVIGYAVGPRGQVEQLNTVTKMMMMRKEQLDADAGTKIPKIPEIPVIPAIEYGRVMSKYFQRCPFTDVLRQKVYTAKGEEIKLPTDRLECVGQPYKREIDYYDAFGNRATEFDECGELRLPTRRNYIPEDGSDNEFLEGNVTEYPTLVSVKTSDGIFYKCWGVNSYSTDIKLLLPSQMLRDPPFLCVYPAEWSGYFCSSWKKKLPWSVIRKRIPFEEDKIKAGHVGKNEKSHCNVDGYDGLFRRNPFVALRSNFSNSTATLENKLEPSRVIRLYTRQRNGLILRFKANARYLHHPYLRRFLMDYKTPYNYYDCFGEKMDEFDDCGNLPFSITRMVAGKWEKQKPKKISYDIQVSPTKKMTLGCFEQQIYGYTCGYSGLITSPTIIKNLPIICGNFKKYYVDGNYDGYIGSD